MKVKEEVRELCEEFSAHNTTQDELRQKRDHSERSVKFYFKVKAETLEEYLDKKEQEKRQKLPVTTPERYLTGGRD